LDSGDAFNPEKVLVNPPSKTRQALR